MCGPNSRMNRPDVDHLQDQVRRVEVEPDRAAPLLQDPAPDRGLAGDVVAARPLVVREDHRAVLDASIFTPLSWANADDVRPDAQRLLPVLVVVLRRVAAHEGVHERHAHEPARPDHLLDVADHRLAVGRVGVERVGVEAQAARSTRPLRSISRDDLRRLAGGQVGDVDVARPGVAARRRRSVRGQQAISRTSKPFAARPVGDLHERRVGERRGQQAELHRAHPPGRAADNGGGGGAVDQSTQRPSRALRRSCRRRASLRGRRRTWRTAAGRPCWPAATSA